MDIKKLLKTYTFWIAFFSGLFLLVQYILSLFNIFITKESYMAIVDGILGVFVFLGIITAPPAVFSDEKQNENEQEKQEEVKKETENKIDLSVLSSLKGISKSRKDKTNKN